MNIVALQLSPIFRLKLGERAKKGLHSNLVRDYSAGQEQTTSPIICVLQASAQLTKGEAIQQFCILFYANYTILATQRGGMAQWPPPPTKYAPVCDTPFDQRPHFTILVYATGVRLLIVNQK